MSDLNTIISKVRNHVGFNILLDSHILYKINSIYESNTNSIIASEIDNETNLKIQTIISDQIISKILNNIIRKHEYDSK